MTLISILALGIVKASGTGNRVSSSIAQKSQAQMAALSGLDIAYRRLATDLEYEGETCTPFEAASGSVEISLTDLGGWHYEVLSQGVAGSAESLVCSQAIARQWVFTYPLSVGRSLILRGEGRILGDAYVKESIRGYEPALIAGNLFMAGERDVRYNTENEPISVDGNSLPHMAGDVYDLAPDYEFPTLDLTDLRQKAIAAGQVYSGRVRLRDIDLEGVVYLENCSRTPKLKNVTIDGVLVLDHVSVLSVESDGYLKIRANDDACQNVAILAPNT